jgi:hypothetical protein
MFMTKCDHMKQDRRAWMRDHTFRARRGWAQDGEGRAFCLKRSMPLRGCHEKICRCTPAMSSSANCNRSGESLTLVTYPDVPRDPAIELFRGFYKLK